MVDFASLLIEDVDVYRHWHPQSEKYAGGDSLATALLTGWTLKPAVFHDIYWHAGTRQVNVYHFELTRGTDSVSMPVIVNPYIDRLIRAYGLQVIPLDRSPQPRVKAPVLVRAKAGH